MSLPPQECYSEDRRVWNAIFERICADLRDCELNGVQLEGGDVIYPICLGNKGDWSYLVSWLHHVYCGGVLFWNMLIISDSGILWFLNMPGLGHAHIGRKWIP